MIFLKNEEVKVIGGHYKGKSGVITAVRNSTRDGRFYMVEFDTALRSVQVAAKFLKLEKVFIKPTPEVKECCGARWMGGEVLDKSPDSINLSVGKQGLVTLIYEENGKKVANFVYQGEYAVVLVKDLQKIEKFRGYA